MNPAIDGLMSTIEQACTIALNRARRLKLTEEQIDIFVKESKEAGADDLAAMLAAAKRISDLILAPHREFLLRNNYESLDTLSSLTFEEYCEYQILSEKRMTQFMVELDPIMRKLYQEQILPKMIKDTLENSFLGDLFKSFDFGLDLPPEEDENEL